MGLATDALLIITQFGFCCVYLVFVSHNLTTWIPLSQDVILFASAPAFVLMSYIRTYVAFVLRFRAKSSSRIGSVDEAR